MLRSVLLQRDGRWPWFRFGSGGGIGRCRDARLYAIDNGGDPLHMLGHELRQLVGGRNGQRRLAEVIDDAGNSAGAMAQRFGRGWVHDSGEITSSLFQLVLDVARNLSDGEGLQLKAQACALAQVLELGAIEPFVDRAGTHQNHVGAR